jgi:SAM-dependent methyltransferase
VAAGLTPFGESVWPGVRNDLFLAHESIYRFFSTYAEGRRVFDAGCGTGYGAFLLARAGARSVLAVDIDRRSLAFARRHFAHPAIRYETADLNTPRIPSGSVDLVVSSNVLEHLTAPAGFVAEVHRALPEGARAILAVPPITSPTVLDAHHAIHFHRSNLNVDEWLRLLQAPGWREISIVAHRYDPTSIPDFFSPFPSRLSPAAFTFEPATREDVYAELPLTAGFVLTKGAD